MILKSNFIDFYMFQLICMYGPRMLHLDAKKEIASCLLKYFKDHIDENKRHLILNSDSCGGQNRNIRVSLMLKHCLAEENNVDLIEQEFFLSGHSFNSCDRSFSLIEKKAENWRKWPHRTIG